MIGPAMRLGLFVERGYPHKSYHHHPNHSIYGYGNGDDAEEGDPDGCAMGWSISHFLYPKGRSRRLQRRALSRLYSLCSSCIQLQRLAHHAHRILVQPVQVDHLAQPWRRTQPGSLLVSTFYTTLV